MGLGPSAGEGMSPILVPNTLRHFSIKKTTRLPAPT
jgi:hypothetical protein